MPITTWDAFQPQIQSYTEGSSGPQMDNASRLAAIEFCTMSQVYREDLDPMNTLAGVAEYDLSPPLETRVVVPVYVSLNGVGIAPTNEDALPTNWRSTPPAPPQNYLVMNSQSIYIYPTPLVAAGVLFVRAALKPDLATATGIEERIFVDWGEVIAHGAAARLLAIPGKPWSNPEANAYHQGRFIEGINNAKISINNSLTSSGQSVQMMKFV